MSKTKEGTAKAVKVYSTSTCTFCHQLREFLKEHNIKFKDLDVGSNEKAAAEMIKKTGQRGVPVIEIGDAVIIGFDEQAIRKALGLK